MRTLLDLKKLGARGGIGYLSRVLLGKFCCFARVRSSQVVVIIIQGEYFVTHRFPDFFEIQKLSSSTVHSLPRRRP